MVSKHCCLTYVLGFMFCLSTTAAIAQDGPTHSEYRKALHRAANDGVTILSTAGNWDMRSVTPQIARSGDGAVKYFRAPDGSGIPIGRRLEPSFFVKNFLMQNAAAFGIYTAQSDIFLTRTTTDDAHNFYRFGQTYAGVVAQGAEIIVQTDATGSSVQAVFADLMRDTYVLDTDPRALTAEFSENDAISYALADSSARIVAKVQRRLAELDQAAATGAISPEAYARARDILNRTVGSVEHSPDLVIHAPEVFGDSGDARLAWRVNVRAAPAAVSDENVFIDARTGEVLRKESRIQSLGDRKIYDVDGATTTAGATLRRSEGGNPAGDAEVDDNYDILGTARSYFTSILGWTGYINPTSPNDIVSYVDWGATGLAAWDSSTKTLRFGQDRYSQTDDVVGHEYAHGVLDQVWAGHATTGETGAIAESFCDFFGEMIDLAHTGNDSGDPAWAIGEDLTGGTIRDMSDPYAYDQPSWRGSTIYYYGEDDDIYVSTNSGVGNKLWYLLTDGGTFYDYTVTGLGQSTVAALVWEALNNVLTTSAGYEDLHLALRSAAENLYTGTTLADVLASIDEASVALGMATDLDTVPMVPKGLGQVDVHIWHGYIAATTGDGYPSLKFIPYKVYVPDDGLNVGGSEGRGYADWPLDVIILSHGAGQNREIATGWDDNGDGVINEAGYQYDIDGLALHWARQGYIVVAPTYRKRLHLTPALSIWEWPFNKDNEVKFITDLLDAFFLHPDEFFADRVRDLKFIRENLDAIINVGTTSTAYDDSEVSSSVGLAGHSYGALTTMLAAGAVIDVGLGASTIRLDLEDGAYGFTREYTEGSGTDDDHGAFVPASSYLLLSDAFQVETDELTLIDPDRPNLTGKDFVQKPLMVATAELDPGAGTGPYFTPVTDAVGLNASPSYGLAVDGANHLTPVTQFNPVLYHLPSWNTVITIVASLGNEFSTSEQRAEFADQDSYSAVAAIWQAIFNITATRSDEEDRLDTYKEYTRSFWDAFLSPEYGGASALAMLNRDKGAQQYDYPKVLDYAWNEPKQVFIVRDSADAPLLQFQRDGNLLVTQGELLTSQSALSQTTGVADFVLKDISGTIQALVCETVGDFRIRGALSDNQSSLSTDPNTPELIIRDASGTPLFIIDEDGNLSLTGNVYDDNDL